MDRFDTSKFNDLLLAVEEIHDGLSDVEETIRTSVKDVLCATLIECTQMLSLAILRASYNKDDREALEHSIENVVEHTNAMMKALHEL